MQWSETLSAMEANVWDVVKKDKACYSYLSLSMPGDEISPLRFTAVCHRPGGTRATMRGNISSSVSRRLLQGGRSNQKPQMKLVWLPLSGALLSGITPPVSHDASHGGRGRWCWEPLQLGLRLRMAPSWGLLGTSPSSSCVRIFPPIYDRLQQTSP